MAKTLTAELVAKIGWLYQDELDLGNVLDVNSLEVTDELASGTAVDQADLIFHDRRTLTASANDDIDLAGSLVDAFGDTLTFAKIKGILIRNRSTTVGDILNIGGGSANFINWIAAAGDIVKLGPGGVFLLWNPSTAGYAVTATTADILRITEAGGANSVDYDIVLIGTSA